MTKQELVKVLYALIIAYGNDGMKLFEKLVDNLNQ